MACNAPTVPLATPSQPTTLGKVRTENSTDTNFPASVPTLVEPKGDGVLDLANAPGCLHPAKTLWLLPFGKAANDQTFNLRVIGWRQVNGLWAPALLCQAAVTLSSSIPGVSGAAVGKYEMFADTVTVTNGVGPVAGNPPANSLAAYLAVGTEGHAKIEVQFDLVTATEANALWATY